MGWDLFNEQTLFKLVNDCLFVFIRVSNLYVFIICHVTFLLRLMHINLTLSDLMNICLFSCSIVELFFVFALKAYAIFLVILFCNIHK